MKAKIDMAKDILKVTEKASKKYEMVDKKYKNDIDYRTGEQLIICCRALEKIENIAIKALDERLGK
jgi:hypothetical protein